MLMSKPVPFGLRFIDNSAQLCLLFFRKLNVSKLDAQFSSRRFALVVPGMAIMP